MQEGPLQRYRQMVEARELAPDTAQELAAEKLQLLANRLAQRAEAWAFTSLCAAAPLGARGALSLWRGWARQDHAARSLLRDRPLRAEAPRALPEIHGRSA